MAISYVNNALGSTTDTTSFSITLPTTQNGDIIILEFTHRSTGDGTIGGTSVSSGGLTYTLKHSQLYSSSAFSGKTYWARATGDHSGQTVTGSGLSNSCAAIVTIYRGAIVSGDPLADATIVGEQNASADESQAQITTTTNGAWVVLVVATSPDVAISSQSSTSPATLTERAERLSTGGTDTAIAHASAEKATAGATGSLTWSMTNQVSGSWAYAITPAPAPPTTVLDTADDEIFLTGAPTLGFTGTDVNSQNITYEVAISTGSSSIVDQNTSSFFSAPGMPSSARYYGHTITGNGGDILSVTLGRVYATGTPGNILIEVYNTQEYTPIPGDYIPTGSSLATSDATSANGLSGTSLVVNFSGANRITLDETVKYAIVVHGTGFDASNYVSLGHSNDASHSGNAVRSTDGGASFTTDTTELMFSVLGEDYVIYISEDAYGFNNLDDGADTDPFTSGDAISYTVQPGHELDAGAHDWRARGKAVTTSLVWGPWATNRDFTVSSGSTGNFFLFF